MDYSTLDLGTAKPSVVPYQEVVVEIDPTVIVDGYAEAIRVEAERMNPLTYDRVQLTSEELEKYFRFLIQQRVLSLTGNCPLWRKLKQLYIPSFLQFAISMVGIVDVKRQGIRLVPQIEDQGVSFEDALATSDRLHYFEGELAMVKDAMPRSPEGDYDTMSTALIAGYMKSMHEVEHPIATYCAAFLGFKLREEQMFSILYRVSYDDIEYLRSTILQSSEVRGRNAEV